MPVPPAASPPAAGRPARDLVATHRALATDATHVLAALDDAARAVVAHIDRRRDAAARAELARIEVTRLGELTDRNLRLRALLEHGYVTVADLLGVDARTLDAVPGVGSQTARAAVAAAEQLATASREAVVVRIEVDRAGRAGPDSPGELVLALHRWMRLAPLVQPQRDPLADYARSVAWNAPRAARAGSRLLLALSRRRTKDAAAAALAALAGWEPLLTSTGLRETIAGLRREVDRPEPPLADVWDDVERRIAEYYTALETLSPGARGRDAAHGLMAAELAERVEARSLDLARLTVALRGYQEFGARFALNQGRALLGDEMGLGKTLQALAVMSDLAGAGADRFLVVCPAGVLPNWLREVAARTTFAAHRLHGPERAAAAARWAAEGGVAVTTYEGLARVPRVEVDLLVVDEAHYVKNPKARRSRHVERWARSTWRVLAMTGTPMDNRLEDFVALVRLLQPQLVDALPRHLALVGANAFRRAVAPVYLRRNAADVLVELPELVVVDEWLDLPASAREPYARAVRAGNVMAMRRATFQPDDPARSVKLARLVEIVDDAAEGGHRTVVFTYFRDVVDVVVRALGARHEVHGPLTGDATPDERAAAIDRFAASDAGGVLVAQVSVGGVGLNLQAASVVVLCEPQLTPGAEAQAFARLHRMGQVRSVRAHRLLAEDVVDERIVEALARKAETFDTYVRPSTMAAASLHAVDVTRADLAREVVVAEQARLGYGPVWDQLTADAAPDEVPTASS